MLTFGMLILVNTVQSSKLSLPTVVKLGKSIELKLRQPENELEPISTIDGNSIEVNEEQFIKPAPFSIIMAFGNDTDSNEEQALKQASPIIIGFSLETVFNYEHPANVYGYNIAGNSKSIFSIVLLKSCL